jgi:hypothetical protein
MKKFRSHAAESGVQGVTAIHVNSKFFCCRREEAIEKKGGETKSPGQATGADSGTRFSTAFAVVLTVTSIYYRIQG